MHEVHWHCSCPTGKHLWCESCQGQMVFGTWLMSLCSWGLPVLPSAALLQRCYYRRHSVDPLMWVLWRKVVCQAVHQGDKSGVLCSMSSFSRGLLCCVAFCSLLGSELYLGFTEMCQAFGQRGLQQGFCLRILCKDLLGPWSCSELLDC